MELNNLIADQNVPIPSSKAYLWSEANANGLQLGRYLTLKEWEFILDTFRKHGFPKNILDVGGGDGRFAVRLNEIGSRVIVLDRDPIPIQDLQHRGWEQPVLIGDGNQLPFQESSFDAVIAIEVIGYIHLECFLESVRRLLKPGGLLIMTSYNAISLLKLVKLLNPFHQHRKIYPDPSRSFWACKRIIREFGFRYVESYGFRWIPGNRKSNNRLIPFWSRLEKLLLLKRIPQLSPWIFWVLKPEKK